MSIKNHSLLLAALLSLAGVTGCSDRPHQYGQERPPVDQLTEGDSGLQSKDVVSATDQLAADLLSLPELNQSQKQWTIVLDRVDNKTTDPSFSYDIFLERLKVQLSRLGRGRIQLISQRDAYKKVQSRELEQQRDDFEQGGNAGKPGPIGTQPDFGLVGTVIEMPNRSTSYYMCSFDLTNLKTREVAWSRAYEVKTAR